MLQLVLQLDPSPSSLPSHTRWGLFLRPAGLLVTIIGSMRLFITVITVVLVIIVNTPHRVLNILVTLLDVNVALLQPLHLLFIFTVLVFTLILILDKLLKLLAPLALHFLHHILLNALLLVHRTLCSFERILVL